MAPTYVNDWHANSTNQATLSVSPATQGNLMALAIEANNTGTRVASVSGGGVSAWHLVTYNSGTAHEELWEGTVTSTGASSITVTYIATPGASCDLDAQEFTAGLGANTNWFVTNSNTINNSASTTITYPSLRASGTNGLYWGYARSAGTGSAGSTSGFSYTVTGASNVVTYNPTMTSGSTYQPTASNTNNSSHAVAMIVMASISSLNVIGSSQLSGNVTSPVVFGAASNMQGAFHIEMPPASTPLTSTQPTIW